MIATLRVDGIVHGPNGMIAVVSNPQMRVYFLREGDHLYDGDVEHITMEGVSFHETGKDAFGKPVERESYQTALSNSRRTAMMTYWPVLRSGGLLLASVALVPFSAGAQAPSAVTTPGPAVTSVSRVEISWRRPADDRASRG